MIGKKMKIDRLDNGTKVYYVPLKDINSTTVLVMYPVGSRYEPEKISGASHYIEHLMFKGTKKRKNAFILTREIDRLGADYNAFTSKEYTGYYIKAGYKDTKTALDILSDMLYDSLFDEKEMEKEKTVIVEEIKMYNDNPLMNIDNIFEDLMYKGALGRDIAGTKEHVLNYKRKDILEYKQKYYQPDNATLVIAGNIPKETKQWVQEYFGSRKALNKTHKNFEPVKFGPKKRQDRIAIQKKKTDQAQLMLGFPAYDYNHKNKYALKLLNTILGGSMSSRLFMQIREKRGLAYMVKSADDSYRDTGYSYVRVGLDAKNINKTIDVVKDELNNLMQEGLEKVELRDAKTRIKGLMALTMEDSSNLANWYARQDLFMDNVKSPQEWLEKIDNIKMDDLVRIANEVFDFEKMRVAIIGNVQKNKIKF